MTEDEAEAAVLVAGLPVTLYVQGNNRLRYVDRDGVRAITLRSQSAIDKWVSRGWLLPSKKHGSYSLFRLSSVLALLASGKLHDGKVKRVKAVG